MLYLPSYAQLTEKTVIDSEGVVYGKIRGAIFQRDYLSLIGFVLLGSKTEELLEKLSFKKNRDPVVLIEKIERVTSEAVFLNDRFKNLPEFATYTQNEQYIMFTDIKEQGIYDMNGNPIGNFVDFWIIKGNVVDFELGGSKFTELLKRNKCSTEIKYIVSYEHIEQDPHIGIKIRLNAKELEYNQKYSMQHIVRDIIAIAMQDNMLHKDEEELLAIIKLEITEYYATLRNMQFENQQYTLEALSRIKEKIITELTRKAHSDQVVSSDESKIINRFAQYFIDTKKIQQFT